MSTNVLEESRMNKFKYVESCINPYPERFEVKYELDKASLLEDGVKEVSVAGRITFMRKMGKLSFIVVSDISGKLQIAIKKDLITEEAYEFFKKGYDIGDFIGVVGEMFTTRTGEKTLRAHSITFLGKSLKPLPEKFHGISNVESCYRQRYLDLIMNQDTRDRFKLKFDFIREVRRYLEDFGYYEIETPVLIDHPSGASAKPFGSYHNALGMEVFMRIAPETYLKRAIVGGFTKVFEFARCFRNEGIDASHLQDFTMLEGYQAYFSYKDNMIFLQEMLVHVVTKLFGKSLINISGKDIDFAGEWPVVSFRDIILKDCDIDIYECSTTKKLLDAIQSKDLALESQVSITQLGRGSLIDLLYKKVSRPLIIEPTFLIEHPTDLSPLARSNDQNPDIVDRFQLIINGAEVINAYSELVDPEEQRRRLIEQANLKANGDEEAMEMDEGYLNAMEYGMPPISGWGMGVDRMLQVLTGQENIKDLVLFPLMRQIEEYNEDKE